MHLGTGVLAREGCWGEGTQRLVRVPSAPPPHVPAACLCLGLCLSRCFFDKQKVLCTMLHDHVGKLRAAPQLRLGILGFSGRRVHSGVWQCLAWVPAQPFTSYMVSGQFLHLPELQFPHSREGVTAKLAY